ncbi:MAG: hypothetical protein WCO00_00840 [Rhodospirillaceae bacterium]
MTRNNAPARFIPAFTLTLALTQALTQALAGAGPALAATLVRDPETCQRLAESAPAEALTAAREWAGHGGGDQAQLCRAAALFQTGDFTAAGRIYETQATGASRNDRQIAGLYDRAAWAFLRAGDAGRADYLYSRALEKLPDDAELRIDRGIARAESRKYRDAVVDFTVALKHQPQRADAYYYRAAAYRELMDLKSARDDVELSLRLRPGDAEALVLRGTIRAATGDAAGARLDWREVVRRDPESPPGKAAAASLRRLDEAGPAPAKP